MINIVIPMAGNGSRFAEKGYAKPKPFIDVNGIPMIERIMKNLQYPNARYILIAKNEHLEQEKDTVKRLQENYNVVFVTIDKTTEGAACTVLHTREYVNNDDMMLIANSDQLVDINIEDFINDAISKNLDGSILTFIDPEKSAKWSFAKVDNNGIVQEVAEKQIISDYATVGIYYYRQGKEFVNGAIDMIINNDRFNNEFYVCPVYNYVMKNGNKIGINNIEHDKMHGLGTPEDLEKYLLNHA